MALSREDRAALLQELSALKSELASLQGGGQPDQPGPSTYPMQQPMSMDPNAQPPKTSLGEAVARGGAQGFLMGWEPQVAGVTGAMNPPAGTVAPFLSNPSLPPGVLLSGLKDKPKEKMLADYRDTRDSEVAANKKAQKDRPTGYGTAQVVGTILSSMIPLGNAAKAASGIDKARNLVASGAAIGGIEAAGNSTADLTRGEIVPFAKDVYKGELGGAAASAAFAGAGSAASALGGKALNAGRSLLFRAAVGPQKRAFTQTNGKKLLQDSVEYLDKELKVGVGDTVQKIGEKIEAKSSSLREQLDGMVSSLDVLTNKKPVISTLRVAQRIRDEIAAPLKKKGATEELSVVNNITKELLRNEKKASGLLDAAGRPIKQPKGRDLSFADAVERRRYMQKKAHYDKLNNLGESERVRREIARIWNEEIDRQAEPLLKGAGKAGDAYRALRDEDHVVLELLKHNKSQVDSEAARSFARRNLVEGGAGTLVGVATANPWLAAAAFLAGHVGKKYGNATAGRAAIKIAAGMQKTVPALEQAAPMGSRVAAREAGILSAEDEEE